MLYTSLGSTRASLSLEVQGYWGRDLRLTRMVQRRHSCMQHWNSAAGLQPRSLHRHFCKVSNSASSSPYMRQIGLPTAETDGEGLYSGATYSD